MLRIYILSIMKLFSQSSLSSQMNAKDTDVLIVKALYEPLQYDPGTLYICNLSPKT